jgi:hypothetical protein
MTMTTRFISQKSIDFDCRSIDLVFCIILLYYFQFQDHVVHTAYNMYTLEPRDDLAESGLVLRPQVLVELPRSKKNSLPAELLPS